MRIVRLSVKIRDFLSQLRYIERLGFSESCDIISIKINLSQSPAGDSLSFSVIRQLSKCMVIRFEYHKGLGVVKCWNT